MGTHSAMEGSTSKILVSSSNILGHAEGLSGLIDTTADGGIVKQDQAGMSECGSIVPDIGH